MERLGRWLSGGALALVILFLLLPILVVIPVSFTEAPVFRFPPEGFSLQWYEKIGRVDGLLGAIGLSARLALLATVISLLLGTLCAIALVRGVVPGAAAVSAFMLSPLMLPGLVLGIAMLQALREVGLRDAWWSLLLAHVVITLPFVMRTVLASLSLFDFGMVDAARTLGCSYPVALWRVLVPNILPGFVSGALFAFIASFDNYPVSMFLVDVRTKTLPIQLLNYLEISPDPTLAAVSTCLIALTVAILLLCDRLVGLRRLAPV
jgi:putative spermidine/putrescine transport system permease protein